MILVLKLLLTPLLITLATLAGRRWGPAFSGWFIGFPLTSGPVSIILALQDGKAFAARAAVGNLGGLASISVFCLAYAVAARKRGAWTCLAAGIGAYLLATLAWSHVRLSLWPMAVVSLAINALVIGLLPKGTGPIPAASTGRWDIPTRMLVAVVFVFTLTTTAAALGPHLSGLITPFPIFGSILTVFAHRQQGAAAARSFLRGHAVSLFGFGAFCLAVGALLPLWPIAGAYGAAVLATLAVSGLTLRVTGSARPAPLPVPRA